MRELVDSVGKRGRAGQDLQNVISVAMLSEGWDARNVTHIMGLRAFTSQLLCEQVIGRGLRRVAHDMEDVTGEDGVTRRLFMPEYVNVFDVPLSIFQDVGDGGEPPPPPKSSIQVESLPERNDLEIRWPNLLRVETVVRPELVIDWTAVEPLTLNPAETIISADIAPALGGATDLSKVHVIDLEQLPEGFRLQRLTLWRQVRACRLPDSGSTRIFGRLEIRPTDFQSIDCRHGGDVDQFPHLGLAKTAILAQPVDDQDAVDRMQQPVFAHTMALIERPLTDLIVSGAGGREDFDDPVRRATTAFVVELGRIADHGDIGLHDGVDACIGLVALGQAHVEGGDIDAAGMILKRIGNLSRQFDHKILMQSRRRGRHREGRAVNEFPAFVVGPLAILAVGKMTRHLRGLRQVRHSLRLNWFHA